MRLLATPMILVVDDDPATRSMLTEVLALEGFQSTSAPDGRKALELLRAGGPYVVALDLVMPYVDGIGLLVALKQMPEVRRCHWIILMSGRVNLNELATTYGADSALVKPFLIEQFLDVVSEGLRRVGHEPGPDTRN